MRRMHHECGCDNMRSIMTMLRMVEITASAPPLLPIMYNSSYYKASEQCVPESFGNGH